MTSELAQLFEQDFAFLHAALETKTARILDLALRGFQRDPSSAYMLLSQTIDRILERHWPELTNDEKQVLGKVRLRCDLHNRCRSPQRRARSSVVHGPSPQ